MQHIIVIDDEPAICDIVAYNLQRAGFSVSCANDGRSGLNLVKAKLPALVVLDLMLPELNGVEVCRLLRSGEDTKAIPVIMLTAKDEELDVVQGLKEGADDYVKKPFSPKELVARVEAVLRRFSEQKQYLKGLVVNKERREITLDGEQIQLTKTEFNLLSTLATKPGRVYERDHLVTLVMGDNAFITDRTIDVHIRAIRRKLGSHSYMIETVRGIGYRMSDTSG